MGSDRSTDPIRLTATVHGYVQGVGLRWSTMAMAESLNLVGFAENRYDGDVQVVAEGPRDACQKVLDWLQGNGPRTVRRPGRVESVDARWSPPTGEFRRFTCY